MGGFGAALVEKTEERTREQRDREKIEVMLRKGLSPKEVADYGNYPIELVHEVEQSLLVTA